MTDHDFIGCGEARNKKTAQGQAAKAFVEYLVKDRYVNEADLPVPLDSAAGGSIDHIRVSC